MVTLLMHISCSGLAVFSLTGTLSKSSSVSQPSIILRETDILIMCYSSLVQISLLFSCPDFLFPSFLACIQHSLSKYGVLHVQVRLLSVDDKELRAVRIRSAIRHRHNSPVVMLQIKNIAHVYIHTKYC